MFEYDDHAPSEHKDTPSVDWSQIPHKPIVTDYMWLEKFLPYDPSIENNGPYWFFRFK